MSKKLKLTSWFHYRTKPIRIGVYEVKYKICREIQDGYAYWTGKKWTNACNSVQSAHHNKEWTDGAIQEKSWRGLAENPQRDKA